MIDKYISQQLVLSVFGHVWFLSDWLRIHFNCCKVVIEVETSRLLRFRL